MEPTTLVRAVEALLFTHPEPLPFKKLYLLLETQYDLTEEKLKETLEELKESYSSSTHAFQLDQISGGYQLRSRAEYAELIRQLPHQPKPEKLTLPSCEILAIIASKQPITRAEIESIRGVDSSATVQSLIEKGLIKISGHKDVAGKPALFRLDQKFYQIFSLNSIKDLDKFLESPSPVLAEKNTESQ